MENSCCWWKLHEYYLESSTRKTSVNGAKAKSGKSNSKVQKPKKIRRKSKQIEHTKTVPKAPQPGPSRLNNSLVEDEEDTPVQTESQIPNDDKCCVCKRFYVARDHTYGTLFITSWDQCCQKDCGNWVHLKFCTKLRVARSGTDFICDCCTINSEQ